MVICAYWRCTFRLSFTARRKRPLWRWPAHLCGLPYWMIQLSHLKCLFDLVATKRTKRKSHFKPFSLRRLCSLDCCCCSLPLQSFALTNSMCGRSSISKMVIFNFLFFGHSGAKRNPICSFRIDHMHAPSFILLIINSQCFRLAKAKIKI